MAQTQDERDDPTSNRFSAGPQRSRSSLGAKFQHRCNHGTSMSLP